MKSVILNITALLLSLTASVQVLCGQEISLRVMSMNIKEGAAYCGHKAQPYADLINEFKPDVVALQEVDWKTLRNGGVDWLNEVAMLTGMFPYYSQSFSYQGGGFGNALLTRLPFYKAEKILSTIEGARETRSTGWVYLILPSGTSVRVATTHLALESSEITTRNIADVNKKIFASDDLTPTLLIGDFNATDDSDAIAYARIKWQEIGAGTGPTIPSSGPTKKLDYVMGYPKNWSYTKYEILAHPELSDHCFILADVVYGGE